MAKRSLPKPGPGQEALSLELAGEAPTTTHLFDQMSQVADGLARMEEARAYAARQHDQTPLGIVRDATAELRRREQAYAADRADQDWARFARDAETGQRWLPPRPQDPEPTAVTFDPTPPKVSYWREPGPVVGEDPTPIDGLARSEPIFPIPLDRSIAQRHLPQLQWEAHERALNLRDQTPPVGIINEDDPVPIFPEPDQPFRPAVHIRDDHARWYE